MGSVSVKLAVLFKDWDDRVVQSELIHSGRFFIPKIDISRFPDGSSLLLSLYNRHDGEPLKVVEEQVEFIFSKVHREAITGIWATGSGGKLCKKKWGFNYINEYRAVAEGVGILYPDVNTVFELGGERSKYILLSRGPGGRNHILDYEMNGECAAGTGSFFDQQVERLKYRIEDVGKILETAGRTASIAGRCSVFAKSDMIHAQQRGYQPPEVLKGLCRAVIRNYKGNITKGKRIQPKVAFIGGVAANVGVVNALRELFKFSDGELIVPEIPMWIGAVGAAVTGLNEGSENKTIDVTLKGNGKHASYPSTRPLSLDKVNLLRDRVAPHRFSSNRIIDGYLGVDVGSVSTNLALVDSEGELIHGIYRMTEGRPIDVVSDSFQEMVSVVGNHVRVCGVGTTGSGRELIGILIGADVIKDEITAHKTGALQVCHKYLDKEVDTIFEIGGQDSKFISIQDGLVVDFSLNEACAAGTGSFLEEQAKQIGIEIKGEFAELALKSQHPLKLGERCTVFMEKELVPYLHQGVPKEDICAGLAVSIVQNYLNRVVKKRKIGDVIFFQGGTAYNDSVAAAFATVLDKEIVVPPHNGIVGAIGSALLAKAYVQEKKKTGFRGWDLSRVTWNMREFPCKGCSNSCLIQEFKVEGEKSYWGDKCSDKYRKRTKTDKTASIRDLTRFREELLFSKRDHSKEPPVKNRGRLGIPRALYFYDRFHFWKTYFEMLGFEVILSEPTNQKLIHEGVEATVAEPCFPIQVVHGHLLNLMIKDVENVFLPNVVNEEDPSASVASFICPWAQTVPLVSRFTPALSAIRGHLLYPNIQFRQGKSFVERQLGKVVSEWGITSKENREAISKAYDADYRFRQEMIETGKEVLYRLNGNGSSCVILLGRPYNLYDPGLNLNIPAKLRDLYGVNVLPMDFLPLDGIDIKSIHDHMYWNYGRRILQAARFARLHPHFHIIYLSNFKCGPDSYIRHYVEDASHKPFLFLQLDSHANDAGVMTRIEAFLESKGML